MIELLVFLLRLCFMLLIGFSGILLVESLIPMALPLAITAGLVFGIVLILQILR